MGWAHRTFAEVAQEYLDYALDAEPDDDFKLKPSSRNSVRGLLNRHWMATLGRMAIDTISLSDLKNAAKQNWPSRKTRKNAYSALRQVFAYAVDEDREYINENPASTLTIVAKKRHHKPEIDAYTKKARDALLSWLKTNVPQYVYTYFLVAFYTGMRTGELLALTWDDYRDESFHVHQARVRSQLTTTKTDRARYVLIPDWVCKEINTLPSRFKRGYMFLNQYGRPYLSGHHLNQFFERAHAATGVTRSRQPNYPWRHTYASIGLTSGAQPAFLAKQLGHTLAVFYSTYAKWIDNDKDRDAVERAFSAPSVGAEVGAPESVVRLEP